MKELDKTDRKILKLLQQNAHIAMTELAEKVGLSTTPVTERVRRLDAKASSAATTPASTRTHWAKPPAGFRGNQAALEIGQYF